MTASAIASEVDVSGLFASVAAQDAADSGEDIICTSEFAPVCGADGQTYSNACVAIESGAEIEHDGICPDTDENGCESTFDPVCGVDGNTYINECFAQKSNVPVAGLGACTPAGCPSIEEPVCGMNGRTFINRCEANAIRVPV